MPATPTTTPPTLNASVGFRQVVYGAGTGDELWAFIPPDQLPRLWLMMRDGHQFYLDGDIMVRDVWVDGQKNDKGTAGFTNKPLIKQDVEFHTMAVVSERQGGTHFIGLDITDTTAPTLRWLYPDPAARKSSSGGRPSASSRRARRQSGRCCCRRRTLPASRTTATATPRNAGRCSSTAAIART